MSYKISSHDVWDMLKRAKRHKKTNFYLLPSAVELVVANGDLSYLESDFGTFILVKETKLSRFYYFVSEPESANFQLTKTATPYVAEIVHNANENDPEIEKMFVRNGFEYLRTSVRLSAFPNKLSFFNDAPAPEFAVLEELNVIERFLYDNFDLRADFIMSHAELVKSRDSQMIWVVRVDGIIAGVMVIADHGKMLELRLIAIDENHRGKGYGRLLLKHLINHAIKNEAKKIYLWTSKDNFVAQKLYESFGFARDLRESSVYSL